MNIGETININGDLYRILKQGSNNFCLNNLQNGGAISHVAWTLGYLANNYAEEAIRFDVLNKTIGVYCR